jgi:2'-5' RNA ligase
MPESVDNLGWRTLDACGDGVEPVNLFALVTYIPLPLGRFLDDLRRELVPSFIPRAHATILPPRPLAYDPHVAWEHVYAGIKDFGPFEIAAADVELFESTSVIYIGIGAGRRVLLQMHEQLNAGPAYCAEPYDYHPHITLAQDIDPQRAVEAYELARRRWAEYTGQRWFAVDRVTLVQATNRKRWLDLAEARLGVPAAR